MKIRAFIIAALASSACFMASAQDAASSMPENWTYSAEFDQTLPCDDNWWRSLGDATLDSLISLGIDNNYNLAIAAKRIAVAKTAIAEARAAYMPNIGLSAGWAKDRTSGRTTAHAMKPVTSSVWQAGVTMNWEIDLFGKITSSVKGKNAEYAASRAEYAATMVSLAGQIATVYTTLRQSQAQLQLALSHCQRQERVVKITEARKEAGIGNALEVAQARVVLYSTRASVPQLETAISQSINTLATLLGVYPQQMQWLRESDGALPAYQQIVATGVPMQLIRRRPDVVEAEMQLASYAAQLGVAKKDFLPTISLSGQIGTEAHDAADLMKNGSLTYSIAPTLSWTIFDGLQRKNNVIASRQQMEIGIDNYNQALLTAVQETENAMSSYHNLLLQIDLYSDVVTQSQKAYDLSLDLYKQGLAPFTNVVDAQLDLLQYENSLISTKAQAVNALVSIYEALGGGWQY